MERSAARQPAWHRRKDFRAPEILTAAVALLEERGFDRFAVADVARSAGVSEATAYKYFENKEALLAQAVEAALTPLIERLETEIPSFAGCAGQLERFVVLCLQDMAERPNIHRPVHGPMRWTASYKPTVQSMHRRFGRLIDQLFKEGIARGELREDTDIVLAGDQIFGAIEGLGWRVLLQGQSSNYDIADFARRFVTQLMAGIGPRE
ncbi:TetR/AcrR family transcriptional regulator [Sphingomonas sp. YL-JM2C]